jgi:hypothetical protein
MQPSAYKDKAGVVALGALNSPAISLARFDAALPIMRYAAVNWEDPPLIGA